MRPRCVTRTDSAVLSSGNVALFIEIKRKEIVLFCRPLTPPNHVSESKKTRQGQHAHCHDGDENENVKNWLPAEKRIEFKILLITYKTIHGQSADYLKPLIEMYQPSRNLRSASRSLLCPQKAKTENYGCRAFSFVAPKLWNSLPEDIKNAKTVICFNNKLKTHLFRKTFLF